MIQMKKIPPEKIDLEELKRMPTLNVTVHVVGLAFRIEVDFRKRLWDSKTDLLLSASTWRRSGLGTHGGRAEYILSGVPEYLDEFLVEYLRVNQEHCGALRRISRT